MMEVDIIFWMGVESRVDYRKKTWKAQPILELGGGSRETWESWLIQTSLPRQLQSDERVTPGKIAILWFEFIGRICASPRLHDIVEGSLKLAGA